MIFFPNYITCSFQLITHSLNRAEKQKFHWKNEGIMTAGSKAVEESAQCVSALSIL
jgi:hypothetical protein